MEVGYPWNGVDNNFATLDGTDVGEGSGCLSFTAPDYGTLVFWQLAYC